MSYEQGYDKYQNVDKYNEPLQTAYNERMNEELPDIEGAHSLFNDFNKYLAVRGENINDIENSLVELQQPWVYNKNWLQTALVYLGVSCSEYEPTASYSVGSVVCVSDTQEIFICIENVKNAPPQIDKTKFLLISPHDFGVDIRDDSQIKIEFNQNLGQALIKNKNGDIWETVAYWYSSLVSEPQMELAPMFIKRTEEHDGQYLMYHYDDYTHSMEQVEPITIVGALECDGDTIARRIEILEGWNTLVYGVEVI